MHAHPLTLCSLIALMPPNRVLCAPLSANPASMLLSVYSARWDTSGQIPHQPVSAPISARLRGPSCHLLAASHVKLKTVQLAYLITSAPNATILRFCSKASAGPSAPLAIFTINPFNLARLLPLSKKIKPPTKSNWSKAKASP